MLGGGCSPCCPVDVAIGIAMRGWGPILNGWNAASYLTTRSLIEDAFGYQVHRVFADNEWTRVSSDDTDSDYYMTVEWPHARFNAASALNPPYTAKTEIYFTTSVVRIRVSITQWVNEGNGFDKTIIEYEKGRAGFWENKFSPGVYLFTPADIISFSTSQGNSLGGQYPAHSAGTSNYVAFQADAGDVAIVIAPLNVTTGSVDWPNPLTFPVEFTADGPNQLHDQRTGTLSPYEAYTNFGGVTLGFNSDAAISPSSVVCQNAGQQTFLAAAATNTGKPTLETGVYRSFGGKVNFVLLSAYWVRGGFVDAPTIVWRPPSCQPISAYPFFDGAFPWTFSVSQVLWRAFSEDGVLVIESNGFTGRTVTVPEPFDYTFPIVGLHSYPGGPLYFIGENFSGEEYTYSGTAATITIRQL